MQVQSLMIKTELLPDAVDPYMTEENGSEPSEIEISSTSTLNNFEEVNVSEAMYNIVARHIQMSEGQH